MSRIGFGFSAKADPELPPNRIRSFPLNNNFPVPAQVVSGLRACGKIRVGRERAAVVWGQSLQGVAQADRRREHWVGRRIPRIPRYISDYFNQTSHYDCMLKLKFLGFAIVGAFKNLRLCKNCVGKNQKSGKSRK